MPMAVNLSLLLGPVVVFDTVHKIAVILLPAHPASFAHKCLFQQVPASPGMQMYCRLVIKNSVLDS